MSEKSRRSSSNVSLKSSSSSIETTVTKLLISTKHLLHALTQWSKGAATGRDVSDAYVQLGNDFKVVSKFFAHAKVDTSDLGDVPTDLRRVLEVTLREPACDETLNKHLPSIREIIVTLLDKLKVKQTILKDMKHEQFMRIRHQQTTSTSSNTSLATASTSPSISDGIAVTNATSENKQRIPDVMIEKVSTDISKKVPDVNDETIRVDNGNEIKSNLLPKLRNSQNEEALEQLKKGNNLQRRASKRFSAYQMAKLANQSTTEAAAAAALASVDNPIPQLAESMNSSCINSTANPVEAMSETDNPETINKADASPHMNSNSVNALPVNASGDKPDGDMVTLFLTLKDKTKKCITTLPRNMNSLRLLFVERFAYSPGGNAFPDIYMKDTQHDIFYELDEQNLNDLKDGSIIKLLLPSTSSLDSSLSTSSMDEIRVFIKEELARNQKCLLDALQKSDNVPSKDSTGEVKAVSESSSIAPVYTRELDNAKGNKIKHDLAIIKQIHNVNRNDFTKAIEDILEKITKFKSMSFNTKTSANRVYMDKSQNELGEVSDSLLSRVDDLQDIIEVIRKDVADRGAKPSKKKLESVQQELLDANNDMKKMEQFIAIEKPHWKKIWETELDKVCEEQQFLTLQEELVLDLKEDLGKASETFTLINLCCEEQEKNPTRTKTNPILPILKPGTFTEVRNQLLVDVLSITPDHESRLEAIGKAEKLWQKEREYRAGDEFQDELGDFVEKSALKKSGGVEEVERLREQKNRENLRANFNGML
ncbi:formin-mediated actin nucleation enhancer NDAI_0J01740 [Naumovozyma dairenensis CBS 421]|uniref:Actin interacting protein 3 C-terminal domain-containing protein n=1 Tax=Naumovozyma dairenensis (strain ATCC 10597 / BCRC 20456 / CBS 421 / NBRC 0211 / NRRL Y-12639) TaxID=1071378 RepID=G0WGY8_NAUDC|nr:hypothetical protein NDAI_0J01740 [Naumovozyma dairenensis CBS 421]CCD27066.1 hypothetical protein NDAI_0J01740 [Naumovozyma dairenensis CBS 421]